MKQIIIILLIAILAFIGLGQYNKYKRFSLEEYEYREPNGIDGAGADKGLLLDYYQAVEVVNGYVITQWSANNIDVRNPKKDNGKTRAAVMEYRKKLANVVFYEEQLLNHKTKFGELEGISEAEKIKEFIRIEFYGNPSQNSLRIGDMNALAYEVQRILIKKGDSIKHDGIFSAETVNALRSFEEKNGLFPDGKLDAITLEYLLK